MKPSAVIALMVLRDIETANQLTDRDWFMYLQRMIVRQNARAREVLQRIEAMRAAELDSDT